MVEMADMVAATSRALIHNLNEIKRLENNHFTRLGQGEAKTVAICGNELSALALHYKRHVGSRRIGLEADTCQEIERYCVRVAEAMDALHQAIRDQPVGLPLLFDTYEHGHAAWSLDGAKRSADAKNVMMQLWHDGQAAQWLLPGNADDRAGDKPAAGHRLEELVHLSDLMRKVAAIYQGLRDQQGSMNDLRPPFDEKDALVFNLADLIKKKVRPVLHTVDIASSIHEWATGDLNPERDRFRVAYQGWKNRPLPEARRRF